MPDPSLLGHLPPQWVGICAGLLFLVYILGQLIEKYEQAAKVLPFGQWWRDRQARKTKPLDVADVAKALDDARHQWELEGNSALTMLEARLQSIAAVAKQQVLDIDDLQGTLRAFRAWSGYDSRWHHKHAVDNAGVIDHVVAPHKDFFEYERLWRTNPDEANSLY